MIQAPAAGIRKGLTMSKMKFLKPKKKEAPISDETFELRKLDMYRQYWEGLREFRDQRQLAVGYFNGDQWPNIVENENGEFVRESTQIQSMGSPAMKQNLIKSTIRSLVGQFRGDTGKSVVVASTPEKAKDSEMLSYALEYALVTINNTRELDARALEEFLNSGLPIQRITWKYDDELQRMELDISNVDTTSVFFNGDIKDIRGKDLRVFGRLMDLTMNELIVDFGTTPEREKKLRDIYGSNLSDYVDTMDIEDKYYSRDFYIPFDISKCRVIEVWEKRLVKRMEVHDWMDGSEWYCDWDQKQLDRANAFRVSKYLEARMSEEEVLPLEGEIKNVQKWFYCYYSPYGHILREGETPFDHGSHPYVVLPYPLLDGKITGLVTDLIDAQRQVNRLLIMQDMILSSSIKNTLVFDLGSLSGSSPEEAGANYKKIGGIVVWDSKGGANKPPFELKGAIGNMGIPEMIQTYIRMLQDVSGVNPAMQGQTAQSGTSGKLYDAQISQSSMNSKDMMESFTGLFRSKRDWKALKTFQQYCNEPRMLAIAGKAYTDTAKLYDPKVAKDIDFNLTLGQTSDSPVYKSIMEDTLTQFVMNGFIDIEMWAEQTTMPFATGFLEALRKRKAQAQTDPRGAVEGIAQDAQTTGVGGDQNVINAVSKGIKQVA